MSKSAAAPLPFLALDHLMGPITIHNAVGRALVVTIDPPRRSPFTLDLPVLTVTQVGTWEPPVSTVVAPLMCGACGIKQAVVVGDKVPVCFLCSTWADFSGTGEDR